MQDKENQRVMTSQACMGSETIPGINSMNIIYFFVFLFLLLINHSSSHLFSCIAVIVCNYEIVCECVCIHTFNY